MAFLDPDLCWVHPQHDPEHADQHGGDFLATRHGIHSIQVCGGIRVGLGIFTHRLVLLLLVEVQVVDIVRDRIKIGEVILRSAFAVAGRFVVGFRTGLFC